VLLPRHCAGPLLAPFGAGEGPEYRRQSEALADAWCDGEAPVRAIALEGHDHFSIVDELARSDSELTDLVLGQMGLGQMGERQMGEGQTGGGQTDVGQVGAGSQRPRSPGSGASS